ncbi:MAG: hypothetical protein WBD55_02040, partial [Dehalococcoidia bacterium]
IEARLPKEGHTRVVLSELDGSASSALITELAPGLDPTAGLVQSIVLKAQGNPFFIEEIIATLADKGQLMDDARSVLEAEPFDLSVPDTVWDVLAERIDRLPRDEKQAIQAAAISGRIFWQELVHELTQHEPQEALAALSQRDFVAPIGPAAFAGDWEWCFRHVLVREVAYGGLLRETRRAGHLAAAAWLERRAGDRRNEYATLLAHHYQVGEDWTKASELAELAGDRAAALFALREARASYAQALLGLARLEPDLENGRRQIDVTLKLARVAYFAPTEDVRHALEEATHLAGLIEDERRRVRVMAATAGWFYMAGQNRPAVETAIQAIAGATQAGLEELLVGPYQIVGRAMLALGEYERAVEMIEKSNALAADHPEILDEMNLGSGSPLGFLGMAYQLLGQVEKGDAFCVQGLAIAEEKHDLSRTASAHFYLGAPSCLLGRLSEAAEHLQQSVTMAEETGDPAVVYMALGFLGHLYGQRGELAQAIECLDRSLSLAAKLETLLYVSMLQAFRAEIDIKAGQPEAAVERAKAAVEQGKETRQQGCQAQAHRVLGWAYYYADANAKNEAERELREAISIHRRIGEQALLARTLFELADFLRNVNDDAGGSEAEAEASAIARDLHLEWLPMPSPAPGPAGRPRAKQSGRRR